jgi:hypothetical protein
MAWPPCDTPLVEFGWLFGFWIVAGVVGIFCFHIYFLMEGKEKKHIQLSLKIITFFFNAFLVFFPLVNQFFSQK